LIGFSPEAVGTGCAHLTAMSSRTELYSRNSETSSRPGRSGGADGARRGYHHGDLARALLDEAGRALREGGPDTLSLRALARALGVDAAAPYRHYASKEALLAELAREGFATLAPLRAGGRGALSASCSARSAWAPVPCLGSREWGPRGAPPTPCWRRGSPRWERPSSRGRRCASTCYRPGPPCMDWPCCWWTAPCGVLPLAQARRQACAVCDVVLAGIRPYLVGRIEGLLKVRAGAEVPRRDADGCRRAVRQAGGESVQPHWAHARSGRAPLRGEAGGLGMWANAVAHPTSYPSRRGTRAPSHRSHGGCARSP